MAALAVEWVLVVFYGPEAHRATYGRQVQSDRYTKDYIQLSRKKEFIDAVTKIFAITSGAVGQVPLTYKWPDGSAPGAFVFRSADRPHLSWATTQGAPKVWKMRLDPSDETPETIPGDPSRLSFEDAENELALLASRGAGQPYLMAIKLQDEARTLHLRAYLHNPSEKYAWADIALAPYEIQALAAKTSQRSALAWSLFPGGGSYPSSSTQTALSVLAEAGNIKAVVEVLDPDAGRSLSSYLRNPGHGLFFDPALNHDAWLEPFALSASLAGAADDIIQLLEERFPAIPEGDAAAERLEADAEEVGAFQEQIEKKSYAVPDSTATNKTRGSAQRVFSRAVKANYEYQCAIAGVANKDFLVASHIVPWSSDQSIRLDPSNGICLSVLVDRAFEKGYLVIEDDLTVRIDWTKVGADQELGRLLAPYDGKKLRMPVKEPPQPEYLQRRRAIVAPAD